MSVKRYDCIGQGDCSVEEFGDGPYVKYEDYAALESRLISIRDAVFDCENNTAAIERIIELTQEYERAAPAVEES